MPELSSNADNARLPHHFAAFVETFFAVVLGASILEPEIRGLLFPPAVTNLGFWALVAVYFTAITSWIGWHKSTIEFPYTDSGAGHVVGLRKHLADFEIKAFSLTELLSK